MTFQELVQKLLEADGILKEQNYYTQQTPEHCVWLKSQFTHRLD
ncbi:MAG: hypothetical protein PWQ06_2863 [Anaerophaga sp.]|nr:hypothetical protein [Anaerophaga sp.]